MPNLKLVFALALSGLLLASCGGREPAATENNAAQAEADTLEKVGQSDPGQAEGSDQPGADSVRPPDAVSHPDGYLPNAGDVPPPSAPEPAIDNPPGSKEPPPATEDEYIRNRQAGS